jgi:hypothetical protein
MASSGPDGQRRPVERTRPDQPLPTPPTPPTPPAEAAPSPDPAPAVAPPAPRPRQDNHWHRMHYPIAAFLVAYGVAGMLGALVGWEGRREDMAGYVGSTLATPVLVLTRLGALLLIAITLAGLLRRRDVWFLPALFGWAAGAAVFTLLALVRGKWVGLLENGAYLAGFVALLVVSYGLSARAMVGRNGRTPPGQAPPAPGEPPQGGLTRTQEFALSALNRLQQRTQTPTRQPPPRP